MELKSKEGPLSVSVFVRMSQAMYDVLQHLAEQLHADGVSTVMRDIIEAAITEGIDIKGKKTNGTKHP